MRGFRRNGVDIDSSDCLHLREHLLDREGLAGGSQSIPPMPYHPRSSSKACQVQAVFNNEFH